MKKNIVALIFSMVWMIAIASLGIYYIGFAPKDRVKSEDENRYLVEFPRLTTENFMAGTYGDEVENFFLDKFPKRSKVISLVSSIKDKMSISTYDEYMAIAENHGDELDTEDIGDSIDELINEMLHGQDSNTEEDTEASTEDSELVDEERPEPDVDAFPEDLGLFAQMNGDTTKLFYAYRDNVLALTAVLNKYAATLPKGGRVMFSVIPQARRANQYVRSQGKGDYYCDFDEVINAFGSKNVYAFDGAEVLKEAIQSDAYIYFRTDMHWTPYGAYLMYAQMVGRAGKTPADYDKDYDRQFEEPFLGTYYRDNPSEELKSMADSLELLTPKFNFTWNRLVSKDEFKEIAYLDMDARANDRFCVYLGGPAGPWTYAECDNGQTDNALVICDSFGLDFIPHVLNNYKQVHYYDPRFYDYDSVGYTVAEMIEKYEIKDIYVVIGDLHSFESELIISDANTQLHGDD